MSSIIDSLFNSVVNTFSSLFNSAVATVESGLTFLNDTFNSLIASAFDFIDAELSPLKRAPDYQARLLLPKVVSDGVKIALGIYAFSLAKESIPSLSGGTILELAVFIQELYGVNKLVDSYTSTIVSASTGKRLERYHNNLYRPSEIAVDEAIDLYYKGEITQGRLVEVLANDGLIDEDIDAVIAGSRVPLGVSLLVRLARIKPLDPNYILSTLKENRLVGDDLQNAYEIIQLDGVRTQLDQFISAVMSEYASGQLPDDVFSAYLDYGIIQANEKTVLMNTGGIKLQMTYIKQKVDIITKAFEATFIDQTTMNEYLTNLGLPPITVNNIVLLELIKVGINPQELLLFPQQQFFTPTGITVTTTTSLT